MAKLSKNKKLLKFEAGARYDAKTDSFSIYTTDEDFEGLPFKMNVISGSSSHNTLLEVMSDYGFTLTPSDKSSKEEKLPEIPVKYPTVEYFENLVPAGVKDSSGGYAYYDLSEDTLCYGLTNSGKTTFALSIIAGALSKDWDVTIVSEESDYELFNKFSPIFKFRKFSELEREYQNNEYSNRKQLIVFDTNYNSAFELKRDSNSKEKIAAQKRISDFKKTYGQNISFLFVTHMKDSADSIFENNIEIKRFRGPHNGFLGQLKSKDSDVSFLLFENDERVPELLKKLHEKNNQSSNLSNNISKDSARNKVRAIKQSSKKYPIRKYSFTKNSNFNKLSIGVDLHGNDVTVDLKEKLSIKGDGRLTNKLIESCLIMELKKTTAEVSLFTESDFENKQLSPVINTFNTLESLENLIFEIMTEQSKQRVLIFCKERNFNDTKSLKVIGILEGLSESKDNNFTFIMSDYTREYENLEDIHTIVDVIEDENILLYDKDKEYSYNKCILKRSNFNDLVFYPYQITEDILKSLTENRIPENGLSTTSSPFSGEKLNNPFSNAEYSGRNDLSDARENVMWLEKFIEPFSNNE